MYSFWALLTFWIALTISIEFSGTKYLTFTDTVSSLAFNSTWQLFMVPQHNLKTLQIYRNNGSDFQHNHTIPLSISPKSVILSNSKRLILIISQTEFQIMETTDFTIIQSGLISGFNPIFSPDQKLIIFPGIGFISVFQENNGVFELKQNLTDTKSYEDNRFIIGGIHASGSLLVYEKNFNSYILIQIIQKAGAIIFIGLNEKNLVFIINDLLFVFLYDQNNGLFSEKSNTTALPFPFYGSGTSNTDIIYICNFSTYGVIEKTQEHEYEMTRIIPINSSMPYLAFVDGNGLYFASVYANKSLIINYVCPPQCTDCKLPNNCIGCISEDDVLGDGACTPMPTHCVQNILVKGDICQEYCSIECQTCNQTKTDCFQCSNLYKMNSKGKCVIKSQLIDIIRKTRLFFNLIRRGSLKFIFLVLDDLWLYSFHKQKYDGIVKDVLQIISIVEENQWELVGLSEVKQQIQQSVAQIRYNPYSNKRYMEEERKNNVFLSSTVDFFCFFLPITIVFLFLTNRIFYLLFNCPISIVFRPYSFWWILFELTIQNNIEYFTFLGFRALVIPFSFDFFSKGLFILTLVMFFLVLFSTFSSYAIYYSWYGKLARYFLVNMYRFPSSYALMIIVYGIKPFLKGFAHALFHQSFVIQLHILAGIELLSILTILLFEFLFENHKSKKILVTELLIMTFFVILNILFLLKYHYLTNQIQRLEGFTALAIYFLIVLLVLRFAFGIFENFEWKCIRDTFCRKRQASVGPEQKLSETKKEEEKHSNQTSSSKMKKTNNFILRLYQNKFGRKNTRSVLPKNKKSNPIKKARQ